MLRLALLLAVVSPPGGPEDPSSPVGTSYADAAAFAMSLAPVDAEDCEPPEPGFLTLDTAPWTLVYVDGEYAGSTPLFKHKLPPGNHTLTLVNEGKGVLSHEDVVVEQARVRKMKLVLLLEEGGATLDDTKDVSVDTEDCFIPEHEAAQLSVDTAPWSRVYVDGKLVGSTPVYKHAIAAGDHVVRLVRADGNAAFARFSASVGEVVKLSLTLTDGQRADGPTVTQELVNDAASGSARDPADR